MNIEYYIMELEERKGKGYYLKHKAFLDAQYAYIESLGEPGDIVERGDDNLVISESKSKT